MIQIPNAGCRQFDILVTGAGPAGVVSAIDLARAGKSVVLIGAPRAFDALEGLAERARRVLDNYGCVQALTTTGAPVARQADWAGERFSGNTEYMIQREAFDQALLTDAANAGVTVVQSRVNHPQDISGQWLVWVDGVEYAARYWIDARGRWAPRTPLRRAAPATVALIGWWRQWAGGPATCLHPFATGWSWRAQLADGRCCAQIVIDANEVPARNQLREHYLALIAQIEDMREQSRQASLIGDPFARGAHQTMDDPVIDDRAARVGDAALAMDPLAGHGIFEALGTAMAVAPCVRTILDRPQGMQDALMFYRQRIAADFWTLARTGRDFYAMQAAGSDQPFWLTRREWPDKEPAHATIQAGMGRIEEKPVSVDGFIERQSVVITPDHPRGVWQIDGVSLVELLRWLQSQPATTPGSLTAAIQRAPWPVNATRSAIDWLGARGLLNLRAGTNRSPD